MEEFDHKIKSHRDSIDEIDKEILQLFKKRFAHVKEVGKLKVEFNIPMMQEKRVELIFKERESFSLKLGLPANFGYKLYQLVLEYACEYQIDVMKNAEDYGKKV